MTFKVNICILFEDTFRIEKNYFIEGFPREIFEVLMSIQAAFFLSHSIRIYTDLYLIFIRDSFIVHYQGNRLRYLGPDERSIGMLLMKVLQKKDKLIKDRKQKSTPGISIQQKKLEDLLKGLGEQYQIILVDKNSKNDLREIVIDKDLILVIPDNKMIDFNLDFLTSHQKPLKLGVEDLPIIMRNKLAILRFYSIFDKFQ